jgi:ferrous iron transport protein B
MPKDKRPVHRQAGDGAQKAGESRLGGLVWRGFAGGRLVRTHRSFAGQAGHFIEPAIAPLGYDWKIGIGLIGSFAAREVFNSTMSVVYAVESEDDENLDPLRDKLAAERRPDGKPVYSPLVCLSLLIFYVFAMQCVSTIAIVKRETGSWKWALIQLGYMTGTAYVLSLLIFQIGTALGY